MTEKKVTKKLNENPDNIKDVLNDILTVGRPYVPVIIKGYYQLASKKTRKKFYRELLKESQVQSIAKDNPYRYYEIDNYCEEQIRKQKNWFFRDDWANLRWLLTTIVAILAILFAWFKPCG